MLKKHIDFINDGEVIKFYKSKEWRTKRAEILKRDNNECQDCKDLGLYSKADCVHHLVHIKVNPYLGLTNNNLRSLCNNHHNLAHPEKLIKARGFYPDGSIKDIKTISERLDNIERW